SITEMEARKRELDQTSDVLEQKRTRLQNHKVRNLETEKHNEKKSMQEIRNDHANKDKTLTTKKQQELRAKERQDELEANLDEQVHELDDMIDDMDQDAADASFLQHSLNKEDFRRNQNTDHDFTVWKKEAEAHAQARETSTSQPRVCQRKEEKIAELDREMAAEKFEMHKLKQEEHDWLSIFEKDKQDKLSEFHTWAEQHGFLPISDDILQQTARDLYRLYESNSYENIRSPFVEAGNDYQLEINKQIARNDSR